MNSKMKAAQISKPGGDWELIERDIPEPSTGEVRVKVEGPPCWLSPRTALRSKSARWEEKATLALPFCIRWA